MYITVCYQCDGRRSVSVITVLYIVTLSSESKIFLNKKKQKKLNKTKKLNDKKTKSQLHQSLLEILLVSSPDKGGEASVAF